MGAISYIAEGTLYGEVRLEGKSRGHEKSGLAIVQYLNYFSLSMATDFGMWSTCLQIAIPKVKRHTHLSRKLQDSARNTDDLLL